MKFDNFWSILVLDLGTPKQFSTQSKPFSAKYTGGRIMVTAGDLLWPIERSEFRAIWNKALSMHEKMRFIHTNYSHEKIRTSSYIISLMRHYLVDEHKIE